MTVANPYLVMNSPIRLRSAMRLNGGTYMAVSEHNRRAGTDASRRRWNAISERVGLMSASGADLIGNAPGRRIPPIRCSRRPSRLPICVIDSFLEVRREVAGVFLL